jgi:hypothetical protein
LFTQPFAGPAEVPDNLDEIVSRACRLVGLPTTSIRLLRHFANAVYLLEDQSVVARVAYGDGVIERSRRAVTITRWLAAQGFAATEPAEVGVEQPIVCAESPQELAVTFWTYYRQPAGRPAPTTDLLGRIARELHRIETPPALALPAYQPLRSMQRLTADDGIESVLGASRTRWLRERIAELLAAYGQLEFPLGTGFIHGDVYSGNLLWNDRVDGAVILGDWDSVSVGPREIDLAPTYAAARFGAAQETLDQFAASYGYDLRSWTGFRTLLQIRGVSTLSALIKLAPRDPGSASQLSYRLASLENDDTTVIWQAQ